MHFTHEKHKAKIPEELSNMSNSNILVEILNNYIHQFDTIIKATETTFITHDAA